MIAISIFSFLFLKNRSSLKARFKKFMTTDQSNLKEAAKILEYVTTVERSLQAIEILYGVKENDDGSRTQILKDAGLKEIFRRRVTFNKLSCLVTIMTPVLDPFYDSEAYWQSQAADNTTVDPTIAVESLPRENITTDTHQFEKKRRRKFTEPRFYPGELIVSVSDGTDEEKSLSQVCSRL